MSIWSALRTLLGGKAPTSQPTHEDEATPNSSSELAAATNVDAEPPTPSEPETPGAPGVIDDWDGQSHTGLIMLSDGATLPFGREACVGFQPLIGLRIAVHQTGIPPKEFAAALWATQVRLLPGTQTEYAARLRIYQVDRAVRGDAAIPGEPPWARNKQGKKPAGPGRPTDAFFALTVVLSEPLLTEAKALAALLDSELWPRPSVRIIPLSRKGQPEPGFSAEVVVGKQRAFLLYRPQPYGLVGEEHGVGHIGLFVGGPHGPRALARLPQEAAPGPRPLDASGEVRLVSALAQSLLQHVPGALGVHVNRASKAWKPRELALQQLIKAPPESLLTEPAPPEAPPPESLPSESSPQETPLPRDEAALPGARADGLLAVPPPLRLWLDWVVVDAAGQKRYHSRGMESLGLPDVRLVLRDGMTETEALEVLGTACAALIDGLLMAQPALVMPGSGQHFQVVSAEDDWLELAATTTQATI
jgi:hypothetical protein